MKAPLRLVTVAFLAVLPLRAAESSASFSYVGNDAILAAVTLADDERVAALIARHRTRLDEVFSDDLHYAHSNGVIDNKETYIDSIASGESVYEGYEYRNRTFLPVGSGVVLMTGRAAIHSRNVDGPIVLDLNFLAVWRLENGRWRFLAWQSSRNPTAEPADAR